MKCKDYFYWSAIYEERMTKYYIVFISELFLEIIVSAYEAIIFIIIIIKEKYMGGLFSSPKAPPPAPPAPPPSAPVEEATFNPGEENEKREKKLTAVKKGKSRLQIPLSGGSSSSGVNKGY